TDEHLERALALGSRYGQGWMFGRPAPTPDFGARPGALPARMAARAAPAAGRTPFEEVGAAGRPERTSTKRLLLALSLELEIQAESLGPEAVVLSNLQHDYHFTPLTRARYRRLAAGAAFVGLLGTDLGANPEPGVRGGDLLPDEPMVDEWSVIVVSPHFAAAMVARDLGDRRDRDMDRRFGYYLTYDRAVCVEAARQIMARISPADDSPRPHLTVL
ncbi:MAG: hypothetical protein JHD16_08575, partial [Solirubrobacteraceae bacterium]|nr:hypothetical protein [Solirubrobacteraceae bacterium]